MMALSFPKQLTITSGNAPAADIHSTRAANDGFRFLTFTDPSHMRDAGTRKAIRQHAMRDVGKARRKPKKKRTIEITLDPVAFAQSNAEMPERIRNMLFPKPSSWLSSGVLDPFLRYPVELDQVGRELVALIFMGSDNTQRPLRDAWFNVGLADVTTFHQMLSNSALHLDTLRNGGRLPEESPTSIHYHQLALTAVKERLNDPEQQATEGMIGTLSGFTCYQEIIGNFAEWNIHRKALLEIVKMHKGGLEAIEKNDVLRVTVSWIELRGIYPQDFPPFFPIPQQWIIHADPPQVQLAQLPKHAIYIFSDWIQLDPCHHGWLEIYKDLISFSLETEQLGFFGEETYTPPNCGLWTNVILYRLLTLRPLERAETPQELIEETSRLGTLLYMAPVWRKYGTHPVRTHLLVDKVVKTVSSTYVDWGNLWRIKLWVLYMTALEARGMPHLTFLAHEIRKIMIDRWLFLWEDVRSSVMGVLWLNKAFDGLDTHVRIAVGQL